MLYTHGHGNIIYNFFSACFPTNIQWISFYSSETTFLMMPNVLPNLFNQSFVAKTFR